MTWFVRRTNILVSQTRTRRKIGLSIGAEQSRFLLSIIPRQVNNEKELLRRVFRFKIWIWSNQSPVLDSINGRNHYGIKEIAGRPGQPRISICPCEFTQYRSVVGCVQRTADPSRVNCGFYFYPITDPQGNVWTILSLVATSDILRDEELLLLDGTPNYSIDQSNNNVEYGTFQLKQQPWNPQHHLHPLNNPFVNPYKHPPAMVPLGQIHDRRWIPRFRKSTWTPFR